MTPTPEIINEYGDPPKPWRGNRLCTPVMMGSRHIVACPICSQGQNFTLGFLRSMVKFGVHAWLYCPCGYNYNREKQAHPVFLSHPAEISKPLPETWELVFTQWAADRAQTVREMELDAVHVMRDAKAAFARAGMSWPDKHDVANLVDGSIDRAKAACDRHTEKRNRYLRAFAGQVVDNLNRESEFFRRVREQQAPKVKPNIIPLMMRRKK